MASREINAAEVQDAVVAFLSAFRTTEERIGAVRAALDGAAGKLFRRQLGAWIVRLLPVETLVPDLHARWRAVVRDAMLFVVSSLSAARLAPKIVEQLELPPETPPETRLLHLIARVPGLQKIGQVVARNRHLHPALRRALSQLENGISDVGIEQIREMIFRQLESQLAAYAVRVAPAIYVEASVSAVVRFTWRNPESGRRERGVFKVLKPHIPSCFAEDLLILQRLAQFLARRHSRGEVPLPGLAEVLTEIRLLLEREVDFRGEQATLLEALRIYRAIPGVRVPRLIQPLSTDTITALTEEKGVKVTDAFRRRRAAGVRVAQRLAEALVAVPALAADENAIFHADPHAGNVLYDRKRGDLVVLDWALTDRLTRKQRKHVLMLVAMTMLRDTDGICAAIEHLRRHVAAGDQSQARLIREHVRGAVGSMPLLRLPGVMDAMHLLHDVAIQGIRFPAALLMFRKATFTLDGVLEDVAGEPVRMDAAVARYALAHWTETTATLWRLLSPGDWLAVHWSAVTLPSRLFLRAVFQPGVWLRDALQAGNWLLRAWSESTSPGGLPEQAGAAQQFQEARHPARIGPGMHAAKGRDGKKPLNRHRLRLGELENALGAMPPAEA